MPEDKNAAIYVGQLNLGMPGNSADAAHRSSQWRWPGLGAESSTGMQRHLRALSVRVQVRLRWRCRYVGGVRGVQ
jgi:hypothetical protein